MDGSSGPKEQNPEFVPPPAVAAGIGASAPSKGLARGQLTSVTGDRGSLRYANSINPEARLRLRKSIHAVVAAQRFNARSRKGVPLVAAETVRTLVANTLQQQQQQLDKERDKMAPQLAASKGKAAASGSSEAAAPAVALTGDAGGRSSATPPPIQVEAGASTAPAIMIANDGRGTPTVAAPAPSEGGSAAPPRRSSAAHRLLDWLKPLAGTGTSNNVSAATPKEAPAPAPASALALPSDGSVAATIAANPIMAPASAAASSARPATDYDHVGIEMTSLSRPAPITDVNGDSQRMLESPSILTPEKAAALMASRIDMAAQFCKGQIACQSP
jgi:hypothetical protein